MSVLEIILAAVLLFIGALLAWTWRDRILPSLARRSPRKRREMAEDILKCLHDFQYEGRRASPNEVAQRLGFQVETTRALLQELRSRRLIESDAEDCRLTREGREYATQVVRAHRLWETYLAEETGIDESEWHERAHRREHELSPGDVDALAARIGNPTHDPHGDPIPTADGDLPSPRGFSLTDLAPGNSARIIHIEDEPAHVYSRIRAEGLYPGMKLQSVENASDPMRFSSGGVVYRLPASAAESVTVLPVASAPPEAARFLSDLATGEEAVVASISKACRPTLRRRLMDLGVLPGTLIRAELRSPAGDPVAYRIRGALIGLRAEQAQHIQVNRGGEPTS